jgi:hypothetical protein
MKTIRGRSFGSKLPLDDIVKENGNILRRAFARLRKTEKKLSPSWV